MVGNEGEAMWVPSHGVPELVGCSGLVKENGSVENGGSHRVGPRGSCGSK